MILANEIGRPFVVPDDLPGRLKGAWDLARVMQPAGVMLHYDAEGELQLDPMTEIEVGQYLERYGSLGSKREAKA